MTAAHRVATRFANSELSADAFGRHNGKSVRCVLYSRGGNVLAEVGGKLKIERGSFAFEVWGGKSRMSQPYTKPSRVTIDDHDNITLDEGNIKWVVLL